MIQAIEAIYEKGYLKPVRKLRLPEHKKICIAILDEELESMDIARLAQEGKSFDFLRNPEQDIYSLRDGQKV